MLSKHGRFPFNQNHFPKLKFPNNLARYTQILEIFSPKFSFHSALLPEFLEFSVEWLTFRKFNSFRNFWKLFREFSVPFAAVFKFLKVLVERKALHMKEINAQVDLKIICLCRHYTLCSLTKNPPFSKKAESRLNSLDLVECLWKLIK